VLEHFARFHDANYRSLNIQLAIFIDSSVCLFYFLTITINTYENLSTLKSNINFTAHGKLLLADVLSMHQVSF